jgi:VWFA-related protein
MMLLRGFKTKSGSWSAYCCVGIALCSLLLALEALAQDSAQTLAGGNQQPTTLSVTTREVLLDVVVTDKSGQPVRGLTSADFVLTEEGDLQHLRHLEEHFPMSAEDLAKLKAAPQLPPNTFSNFTPVASTNASTVILLDALNTNVQAQMELREQLIDCMKHLEPGTPVAIFQVDTEMRLIQSFTIDPHVLLDAAKSKRDMPTLQKPVTGTREQNRQTRLEILGSGFQMMGRYLAGFPGRKNLIWLTGSVPQTYISDPLGDNSFGKPFSDDFDVLEDQPGAAMDALTLSRVAVYPIDARGLQTPPQFQASNNGGGPRGAATGLGFEGRQAVQHMTLDAIAEATGGKAYYNTNGLKQAIASIVNTGSSYYALAYSTTNKKWNGQFRHIKLAVDRPGVRVQYRQGYYAVDHAKQEETLLAAIQKRKNHGESGPFGEDAATSNNSQAAPGALQAQGTAGVLIKQPVGGFEATMQLGAIPPTEVILTASLSMADKVVKVDKKAPLPADNYMEGDYRGKPFRNYIVLIKADAHDLRMTRTANGVHHGTVEFVTVVYDQTGNRVNSLISSAILNVSDVHYLTILQNGLVARQEIAVPVKGNYFLRVGVHDVASDHVGAVEIPVDEVHAGVAGEGMQRQ